MSIYIKYLYNKISNSFNWDDIGPLALINLIRITNGSEKVLWQRLDQFIDDKFLKRGTTKYGLPWVNEWGNNRYASNLAFVGVLAVKLHDEFNEDWNFGLDNKKVLDKAKFVADYMLGENPNQRSYSQLLKIMEKCLNNTVRS